MAVPKNQRAGEKHRRPQEGKQCQRSERPDAGPAEYDGGNGGGGDHASWADAYLTK